MNDLAVSERETHLNLTADNRGVWEVYSDDPVMIRKLDKIAQAHRETPTGKYWMLSADQVRFYRQPTSSERAEYKKRGRRLQRYQQHGVLSAQN